MPGPMAATGNLEMEWVTSTSQLPSKEASKQTTDQIKCDVKDIYPIGSYWVVECSKRMSQYAIAFGAVNSTVY